MPKWIVVTRDAASELCFFGQFDEDFEAISWAEQQKFRRTWWIAQLEPAKPR